MLARTADLFSKIPIILHKCSIDLKSLFNTPWCHFQCLWRKQMQLKKERLPKSVLLHKILKDVELDRTPKRMCLCS